MITCPNCGATARNGAKFCTTCGTKLTGITPTSQTPPKPTAAPSDTDSSETSVWAWPSVTGASAPEPAPVAPQEPAAPASAVDWDWPAPFSINTAPAQDDVLDTEAESGTESTDTPASEDKTEKTASPTSETDALASWAANWNAGTRDDADATPSPEAGSTSEGETDGPVEPDVATATGADDIGTSVPGSHEPPADATEPVAKAGTGEETALRPSSDDQAGSPEPVAAENPVQGSIAEEELPVESEPLTRQDSVTQETPAVEESGSDHLGPVLSASAAIRATALLDELRDLLTASDGVNADDSTLPPSVAAALREALGTETQVETLRAIATQAHETPRDIYAMMDLGRQAADILALIAERDRLRAAIVNALATPSLPED